MENVVKAKASNIFKTISMSLLLTVAVIGIAVLGPLESALKTLAEDIKNEIAELVLKTKSLRVEYETLETEIFNKIAFKKLRVIRDDNSVMLQIDNLSIEYDLVAILEGKKQDLITGIHVNNLDLSATDTDFLLFDNGESKSPKTIVGEILDFLQSRVNIAVNNGKLAFESGKNSLRLNIFQFSSSNIEDGGLKLYQTEGDLSLFEDNKKTLSTKLSFETKLQEGVAKLKLELLDLKSEFAQINRLNIHASLDENGLIISKGLDDNSFDINASYLFQNKKIRADISFSHFPLYDYLTPKLKYQVSNVVSDLRLTGSFGMEYALEQNAFRYKSNLRATGKFLDGPIDLSSRFSGDLDHIDLATLTIANNRITLESSGQLFRGGGNNSIQSRLIYVLDEEGDRIEALAQISSRDLQAFKITAQIELNDRFFADSHMEFDLKNNLVKVGMDFTAFFTKNSYLNLDLRKASLSVFSSLVVDKNTIAQEFGILNQKIKKSVDDVLATGFESYVNTTVNFEQNLVFQNSRAEVSVGDVHISTSQKGDDTNQFTYKIKGNNFENEGVIEAQVIEKFLSFNILTKEGIRGTLNYDTLNGDIEISGPYGILINLSKFNNVYAGNYRFEGLKFQTNQNEATISSFGTIQFEDFENWKVNSPSLSVDLSLMVNGKVSHALLNSDFEVSNKEILVEDIVISYLGDYFNGSASVLKTDKSNALFKFFLENKASQGTLSELKETFNSEGFIDLDNGTIDSRFSVANFDLKRINSGDLSGLVSVAGTLQGSLDRPDLIAKISSRNLYLGPSPASLSLEAHYLNTVNITKLNFKLLNYNFSSNSLVIDPSKNNVSGDLRFKLASGGDSISSTFSVFYKKNAEKSTISINNFPNNLGQRTNFSLVGTFVEKGWQWNEIGGAVSGIIRNDGRFSFGFSPPFLFSGAAEGVLSTSTADVTFSKVNFNISVLRDFLNLGYVSFTNGTVNGNVRIKGQLTDPSFYGNITILDLRGKMLLNSFPVYSKKVNIALEDKTIYLLDFVVENNNSFIRSNGFFQLQKYDISKWQISFNPNGDQGLYLSYNFGPVFVEGYASGLISIGGDHLRTKITGSVEISNSLISMAEVKNGGAKEDLQTNADQGELALDLSLTTAKNVSFQYPNTSIPLIRSNFDRNQTLKILMDTGANTFQMTGVTNIKGGEIFDFKRSFFIRNAQVIFNESTGSFDPRIDLVAESRLSLNNQAYKLILTIDKQRLSNLSPVVTADPFLSQVQINSLLSGRDPNSDTNLSLGDLLATGADLFSSLGILRNFENSVRNLIGVDVFSIRTGIIPSLIKEAVEEKPLDNQAFSFGKYLDNTSLLIGKFITDDMYAEVLTQIKTVDNSQSDTSGLGVKLDFEFSIQWSLPFADLEWRFAPTDGNDLFLRDNAFTFSWRIQ